MNEWYTQIREEPLVVTREALTVNRIDLRDPGLSFQDFRIQYFARVNLWFFGGVDPSGKPLIKPSKDNMPFFGGQNCPFDRPFLRKALRSKFDGCNYHSKDLWCLAIGAEEAGLVRFPDGFRLEAIAKALNVQVEGDMHNALTDARVAFLCWRRLIEMMER